MELVGVFLENIWTMFQLTGIEINGVWIDMADIFIFVIIASLLVIFLGVLLGGGK